MRCGRIAGALVIITSIAFYLSAQSLALRKPVILRQNLLSNECAKAHDLSASASAAVSGAGALAGRWVNVADLLNHRNVSALPPRSGACPPAPARCALQDVFDEVFVISLPRFAERAERTVRQLDALGVPFTLVHAQDARSGSVAAFLSLFWPGDKSPSSRAKVALLATHLDILSYVAQTPQLERVLILEDDIFFHSDFPAQFDRAARNVPTDWRVFWVGASMDLGFSGASAPGGGVVRVRGGFESVYTSFAVGLHRETAEVAYQALLESRTAIDVGPYETLSKRWPQQQYLLWPALAVMTQWTGSTLGHSTVKSVDSWKKALGADQSAFDFSRGYFSGGENGLEGVCPELREGFVFEGLRAYAVSGTRSSEECCTECAKQLPRCSAFVFESADHSANNDNLALAAVKKKGARRADFNLRYMSEAALDSHGLPAFEAGENCALMQGSPGELRAAEPSRKDKLASARVVQVPRAAAAA